METNTEKTGADLGVNDIFSTNPDQVQKGVSMSSQKVESIPTEMIEIPEGWYELFDESSKKDFINELKIQIEKNGYYTPLTVFQNGEKYVIVDGVLRFKALQSLDLNCINCIVIDFQPSSSEIIKDRIIELQMKSEYTSEDLLRIVNHYLRIGSTSVIDETTLNQRVSVLAEILGRGWCRSNIFHFKKLLEWEAEFPNNLKMSEKILERDNSMTVNKSIDIRRFLDNKQKPYTLSNEKETGILSKYINGEVKNRKQVETLIDSFLNKNGDRYTQIPMVTDISTERYQILHQDSTKIKFPENTLIDAIFTSPPYYKQVRYSNIDDPEYENELGWEKTSEEYVSRVVDVIFKGMEVMDEKGVIMININETFKKGECFGIISLYIQEMKKRGAFFIQQCLWVKDDAKPMNNSYMRFGNTYETILIFSKSRKYNFNTFKLRNDSKGLEVTRGCAEQGKNVENFHISNPYDTCKDFMFESVFMDYLILSQRSGRSQDENLKEKFFGSFPTLLPIPFIMSFVPENGTVWDPFGGTGTTGRTVLSLNRKVIITELLEKNIPNIKLMLEKGVEEFNVEEFSKKKLEENYVEGEINMAA